MDADYPALIAAEQVWVAVDPDVIGVIVLDDQADHLQIDNVAVAPEQQGSGVGRALGFAEDRARTLGVPELRLHPRPDDREPGLLRPARLRADQRTIDDGFDRVFFTKS